MPFQAHPERDAPTSYRALTAAIYLAAILLLAWRYLCAPLSNENLMTAFMAQGLQEGRFPFFFYGQNWMGGYDAFILAPLFALFGPSPWVLKALAPVITLATLVLVHRLLARMLSPRGVMVGLAFVALPPATALFWAGYANLHYPLAVFFGALLMLLSLGLGERHTWPAGMAGAWGLVAGAAFYTNFQSVVFLAPAGLYLLLTRPGQVIRPRNLGLLLLGFLLGAAPLIYYNYNQGWPHLGQAGSLELSALGANLRALIFNALPMCLGFNTPASGGHLTPNSPWFVLYLAVLALLLWGSWRLLKGGLAHRRLWLPLAVGLCNLAVLVASHFGNRLASGLLAYLLPFIWLFLPFAWAGLGEGLARWGVRPLFILALLLVLNNAAAYPGFNRAGYGVLCRSGRHLRSLDNYRASVEALRRAGMHHVYTTVDSPILNFLAGGDPVFSDPWAERYATASFRVDAATDAAFWTNKLGGGFQLLGVPHQRRRLRGRELAYAFREPPGSSRMLPRQKWRARELGGRELGRRLSDGTLTTSFRTPGPARAGQGFTLDLGSEQVVGGVSLIPAYFPEMPAGLRVEGAGADGRFFPLRQGRGYWGPFYLSGPHPVLKARHGRVESYFPPRRLRFLRFTHLGSSRGTWSVAEVLAWGPARDGEQPVDWGRARGAVLSLVRAHAPRLVLADTWAAALIALEFAGRVDTVPGNATLDDFGRRGPDYRGPLLLQDRPGEALLVRRRQGQVVASALERAGIAFSRFDQGIMCLFMLQGRRLGRELEIREASSPLDPAMARRLPGGLEGRQRWGTRRAQRPGDSLTLDLGRVVEMGWVELDNRDFPGDYPRGLKALVSREGRQWREVALHFSAPLCFSGQVVLNCPGRRNLYRLARPLEGRYLRLVCTAGDPAFWWSVQGVRILSPG